MKNININPSEFKNSVKKQRFSMNKRMVLKKGMRNRSIKLLGG